MVITKNTTLDDFRILQGCKYLEITKDVALNKKMLEFIFENFPEAKISILSGFNKNSIVYSSFDCIYTEEEVKTLVENVNFAKEKYQKELAFDDEFNIEQAISASRQINSIVEKINSAKVDGKHLSNLEKYLWAYRIVIDRFYKKENEGENSQISRNPIGVLSGDKIVCAGFASLLYVILNKLGIPCSLQAEGIYDKDLDQYVNHLSCCVRIEDDKYNKHGIYYSNPTFDAASGKRGLFSESRNILSFDHALIPYHSINKHYYYQTHRVPIMDKVFPSDDFKSSFVEDRVKVLANLFPEKTQGKSQDVIIYEEAQELIKNSNTLKLLNKTLGSITPDIVNNNAILYSKKLTPVSGLFFGSHTDEYSFNFAINKYIQLLAAYGYSPDDISICLKNNLSLDEIYENIIQNVKKECELLGTDFDSSKTQNYILECLNFYKNQLEKIDGFVQSFDYSTIRPIPAETLIDSLSGHIVDSCIKEGFFSQKSSLLLPEISALLKQGFSFEDILKEIKKHATNIDLAKRYICLHPDQNLYMSSLQNDKEFYYKSPNPDMIYNTPYEEDFAKLVASATTLSFDEAFEALTTIFRAQGKNISLAEYFADEHLLDSFTFY